MHGAGPSAVLEGNGDYSYNSFPRDAYDDDVLDEVSTFAGEGSQDESIQCTCHHGGDGRHQQPARLPSEKKDARTDSGQGQVRSTGGLRLQLRPLEQHQTRLRQGIINQLSRSLDGTVRDKKSGAPAGKHTVDVNCQGDDTGLRSDGYAIDINGGQQRIGK